MLYHSIVGIELFCAVLDKTFETFFLMRQIGMTDKAVLILENSPVTFVIGACDDFLSSGHY